MTAYTLITGASSGIGLALAAAFAARGDALLLVARRGEVLEQIAGRLRACHKVDVQTRICDLAEAAQLDRLCDDLARGTPEIGTLVNNAGFATSGAFVDNAWHEERELIEVNVTALARLCHVVGRRMAAAGRGQILNVSSISGMMPGPWMANYAAAKAYVLSLSEGLREELAPRGVKVSVLCPGTTRSPFFARAGIDLDKLEKEALVMTPQDVARITVAALERDTAIIVPRWYNKILAITPRLGPRWLLRRVVGALYKGVARTA
ncbi:SDR family NAD(P)-dependent oxidoreductase [Solimonas soli]|uniref:SDR family NAD(P)-dependent oxidoreductase n=1 Tax=Solimonas soli TaxID=413479 RepID=UPI00047FCEAA|nr:SDR family oxidoreductase [Solimonas soli]